MPRNRNRSVDLDERRRHAEAFVRALPPAPGHGPLTGEERAAIVAAVRHSTGRCGYRWHGRVEWVGSPVVFDQLTTVDRGVLAARGDRILRRFSVVGAVVLRADTYSCACSATSFHGPGWSGSLPYRH